MKDKDWFEKSSDEYWSDFLDRQRKKAGEHRFDEPEPLPPERRKSKEEYARKNREELARSNPSYQYPSVTVSRTVKGDIDYAAKFRGEADKLLYQVKNLMTFQQLGQLSGQRSFSDGTVIKAKSIFGQDYVEIDTTLSTVLEDMPPCSITFINLPLAVAPMKWYPDGIHTFPDGHVEVEGVDYYKTYYRLDNYSGIEYVEWRPCDTETLMADFGFGSGMTNCHPFNFVDATLPVRDVTPIVANDHCIYSMATCGGEVYSWGEDSGGRYFIWKAFTEWSMLGPYAIFYNMLGGVSRTGLGYMQIGMKITNQSGSKVLCENYGVVKVDCCFKPVAQRPHYMYWTTGVWTPDLGFMLYGDMHLFFVPSELPAEWAAIYQIAKGGIPLYMVPELVGGCFPYTWSKTNNLDLVVWGEQGASATLWIPHTNEVPYGGILPCRFSGSVSVHDRCGGTNTLELYGCCDEIDKDPNRKPLEIEITSFSMLCGETQGFGPGGTGCPPYQASLSGVGTLTPVPSITSGDGFYYQAPATWAGGCETAATVTVTDCCGSSASVSFMVNCWGTDEDAFMTHMFYDEGNFSSWCGGGCGGTGSYVYGKYIQGYYTTYDCEGGVNANAVYAGGYALCSQPSDGACAVAANAGAYCLCVGFCSDCPGNAACQQIPALIHHSYWPSGPSQHYDCDTIFDLRTAAMIAAGCCPINPITGLPFVGVP